MEELHVKMVQLNDAKDGDGPTLGGGGGGLSKGDTFRSNGPI